MSLPFHYYKLSANSDAEVFAIKILAGSVNVTSLRSALSPPQPEAEPDYTLTPKQHRLDGFKDDSGIVRQFVAMPLKWGYTVEGQVSQAENIGGLQIAITPLLDTNVKFRAFQSISANFANGLGASALSLDFFQTPRDLGLFQNQLLLMKLPDKFLQCCFDEAEQYDAIFDHDGVVGEVRKASHDRSIFNLPWWKTRPTYIHELIAERDVAEFQSSIGDPIEVRAVEPISRLVTTADLPRQTKLGLQRPR